MFDVRQATILIADDESTNLQLLSEALNEDYEIFICKDGSSALSLALEKLPNIILLDILMPEMDGYEVCTRLKLNPATKDIPVIFISALADEGSEAYGFELGAVDYIHKPLKLSSIKARVRTHVTLQGRLEKLIRTNSMLSDSIKRFNSSQSLTSMQPERLFVIDASKNIYPTILNTTSDAVIIADQDNRILEVNKIFTIATGYFLEDVQNKTPDFLVSEHPQDLYFKSILAHLELNSIWSGEAEFTDSSGISFPILQTTTKLVNDSHQVTNYITTFTNTRSLKASQERINFLTWYDTLTRLPNRHLFLDRLNQALKYATHENLYSSVIVINLDQFKTINAAHGFVVGDRVLIEVANVVCNLLDKTDTLARISGGEFCILLNSCSPSKDESSQKAYKLSDLISKALYDSIHTNAEEKVRLTASLGINIFPDDKMLSAHDVLQRAIIARQKFQYANKGPMFFSEVMSSQALLRYETEQDLSVAIEQDQLQVFLQSKVNSDGLVCGAEALSRWFHPSKGSISPAYFIPVAEKSNMIIDLDKFVLKKAVELINQLPSKAMSLSVNISPNHFKAGDLPIYIEQLIESFHFNPEQLCLEITENVMIDDIEGTKKQMLQISELGVKFSIDDFGTGYCSLSYLKRLPIHEIKIDRGFILDIFKDPNNPLFVDMIYNISDYLNVDVVAEGVETMEHAEFLRKYPHMIRQGYYYCVPMPSDEWLLKAI